MTLKSHQHEQIATPIMVLVNGNGIALSEGMNLDQKTDFIKKWKMFPRLCYQKGAFPGNILALCLLLT
ncbi:Uncharacterized protein TCM_011579 [Theobroma cacao]|uniref:Uncharacterized protein n=1 Tax=Theobroma cacao TaxID=3641 RepID=A0A061E9T1_THECC|nr:Uncharacterized protein TCM_011579 [Theobroma cacao]